VSGSELYEIQIDIAPLPKQDWQALKAQSAGRIGTLIELLQGKLSKAVMELVTDRNQGLFPKPKEIKMRCSCPDGARMCKHLAAVMYGIGSRLDSLPELLFVLRGVDHMELIEQAIPTAPIKAKSSAPTIATDDLGAIFDIEIGDAPVAKAETQASEKPAPKKVATKASAAKEKKVAAVKKVATKASAAKEKKVAAVKKVATKASPAKGKRAPSVSKKR
jgi:uncharacterized Zn finger protein